MSMSTREVTFWLNGERVRATSTTGCNTTLSQWLRGHGRTGTKEGCAEGDCGACAVLVAERDAAGAPTWRAVSSCITLLPMVQGREVVTVEGLAQQAAEGAVLHPVQAALVHHYGSQCGYCTPGFAVAMAEGYERTELKAAVDAEGCDRLCDQLSGNLCRCTGYRPIRDALSAALAARDDDGPELVELGRRAARPFLPEAFPASAAGASPRSTQIVDGAGAFLRPASVDELLALRAEHPDATVIAGATELGVLVRKRGAHFGTLLSVDGVAELHRVRVEGGGRDGEERVVVGAAASLTDVDDVLARLEHPAVAGVRKMLRVFASRLIRNRATLAGNVVTASPIGDMPPVLLALGATVVCASKARGERRVPIEQFFVGYRKTALAADELVVRIELALPRPRKAGGKIRFDTFKVSKRKELDIAIVSAAFFVEEDAGGVVRAARLAYGGVAPMPLRALQAEAALVGKRLGSDEARLRGVLLEQFTPIDDVRATADYRRGLVVSLWHKFLDGAASEAADLPSRFSVEGAWHTEAKSKALPHDSARLHTTGEALYVDDVARRRPMLDAWPVLSRHAAGRITKKSAARALLVPGVRAVLFAEDIPGDNDIGAIRKDEPLLAKERVAYLGQPVALVVADTVEACQRAAALVEIEVAGEPPLLGLPAAIAAGSFHTTPHTIARGDVDTALRQADQRLSGELHIGGQEHFYLESQAAWAEVNDDDAVVVWSSTQHPSEIQAVVSHVLHVARNKVVVTSPRMGGGFGGKETQGNGPAALVALAAHKTRQPVRLQLDRDVDMLMTGKRHPFLARFEVGFAADGRITALDVQLWSDGGHALDLSESILDRALFHLDNCYFLPHARFVGRVCKTDVQSHTAFRGFGGPQGMLVIEEIMARVAGALGKPAHEVRAANFYADGQHTPYGQPVLDHRVPKMWQALCVDAEVDARRAQIATWNSTSKGVKRGLAVTPVKFGISFTASFLNQGGALVHIYRDGTVQVAHGGTEMGQGLYTKLQGVAARELGIAVEHVRVMKTQTDKVPNTSATAASAGADLNGAATKAACDVLRARLSTVAAALLSERLGRAIGDSEVAFVNGWARAGSSANALEQVPFKDVVEAAYLRQVSLSSTGFYRTPDISYDKQKGRGRPFHYFAYGVCVAEVELCGYTGMKKLRRVDILHDVGDSLHPSVDRGQIEGGFLQGVGWLTGEELVWSGRDAKQPGALLTHSASTYQIPTSWDAPDVFRVRLLDGAPQAGVVHGSKAVGEPPLMLAIAVREALREAIAAFAPPTTSRPGPIALPSPLTHEALWRAVRERRGGG